MIRLPDLDTPGLPKPRLAARPPGRYDADAEWGGPASLGPAALKRADDLRWGWDVVGADDSEHRLAEWQRQEEERFETAVRSLQPTAARGFAEGYANDYFARAKMLKASLPEALQPAIDEKLSRHEQRLFVRATAAEDNAQANAARQRLDESLQTTVIPAAVAAARLGRDDPDKPVRLADAESLAEKLIDANPAMAPHEKEARKAAVAGAIHTAFAEALPDQERSDLDPIAAVESVGARFRRLAGVEAEPENTSLDPKTEEEADEKPTPLNPDGFGREAWLAAIRRHRPDLAKGRSINNILALRSDAELSAEIRDESVAYNARFLIGHGHPATPGNLYLAHVLSREAAVRLLDADPRRPAAEIDEAAARERPQLFHDDGDPAQPPTAGAVIAAAEDAMAGTRPVDWRQRLNGLSPDLLEAIVHDAREAVAQTEAAAKLADDGDYQARLEDAERAIEAGDFGLVDLQKANGEGGWLSGTEDFQRLHGLIAKRAADTLDYERSVKKFTDPNYHFDLASPEDQRAVDLIYQRGIAGNDTGDEEAHRLLAQIVARTGITPTSAVAPVPNAEAEAGGDAAAPAVAPVQTDSANGNGAGVDAERVNREAKSDRLVPESEKLLLDAIQDLTSAFYKKNSDGRSIADGVVVAEEFRDGLFRTVVGVLGEEALENYDRSMAALDEGLGAFREEMHRFIEDGAGGLSATEINNRKAIADFAITSAMVIAPGGGRGRRGERDGDQADEVPDSDVAGKPERAGERPVGDAPLNKTRRKSDAAAAEHPAAVIPEPPLAKPDQQGPDAFGNIDPASKKQIIQPRNSTDRMLELAEQNKGLLRGQLESLIEDLPGVEVTGTRVKDRPRLLEKLKGGRRADTLGDYLGGRIIVDSPEQFDDVVEALTRRYKNVEFDDFLDAPRGSGYRAVHMQIVLDDGMTAEIQIMPRPILRVYDKEHANYSRWRGEEKWTPEKERQADADERWARTAYEKAYDEWLAKASKGTP